MTLSTRSAVLHIVLGLTLLLLGGSTFAGVMILREETIPDLLLSIESARSWFGLTMPMNEERVLYSMAASVGATFLALIGLIAIERFFRRTLSPQVFFFALFLLGLAFEGGRIGQAYLFSHGVSYAFLSTLTRFVAFGRVTAMSSLVASSLYAGGISYQKHGVVLAIIVAVSGGISYASPVNTLVLAPDLLFRVGEGYSVDVLHLLLGLVAVINYLQAAWSEERREYIAHALALLGIVIGWLLIIEIPTVSTIAVGTTLLTLGSALFLKRRYSSYLWS
ncbi:MAG: hypothetical protein ACOCRY_03120 [Alkalispirochaetaceae bacterium]